MNKDILSEYGPNSNQEASHSQGGKRASNGGQMMPKPIPYSPPKGPTEQMRQKPGLGGDNCGNKGTQGKH